MTLAELIQQLNNLAEELGSDTEVRLAMQPSWPFEYNISQVVAVDLGEQEQDDDYYIGTGEAVEPQYIVYLSEGQQIGYLPGQAKTELGWTNR